MCIFSLACWPSVCFLWRNICLELLPIFLIGMFVFFFFCICWVLWALYTFLEINCLSVISFADIYSQSTDCLFILLMIFFTVQKVISLIMSHLFIFAFICLPLWDWYKKILLWFMSKTVLPIHPSRSFMVSHLIFKSLKHFEFTFVHGVREHSNYIDVCVAVQFSQQHWLKRLSFLHYMYLPPLSKINWP